MFGISAALTTPFKSDYSVDITRLSNHIRIVLSEGCNSVTLFGTTGEGPSLSPDIRLETVSAVLKSGIDPARFVLAIYGTASTDIVRQVEMAMSLGLRRFLLPPPFYYGEPTMTGLSAWFDQTLSPFEVTNAQFILYHIPQVIGVGLPIDLVAQLKAAYPDIIYGVKDSSGSFENTRNLLQLSGLNILVGDERQLAACAKNGASGAISGIANLFPNRLARVLATGSDDADINQLVDTVLKFPVTPAIKALVANKYGAPEWRKSAPPLETLVDTAYTELAKAHDLVGDS